MWQVKIFLHAPRITKTVRQRKCGESKYSHMHQESQKLSMTRKTFESAAFLKGIFGRAGKLLFFDRNISKNIMSLITPQEVK